MSALGALQRPASDVMVTTMPPTHQEPLDVKAGSVDFHVTWDVCPVCSPPLFAPHQHWVEPLYSAPGGLSVGLRAVQRSPFCDSLKPVPKP